MKKKLVTVYVEVIPGYDAGPYERGHSKCTAWLKEKDIEKFVLDTVVPMMHEAFEKERTS